MFLLLTLLAACGPHLDADGVCVAPLDGAPACPTEADCDLPGFEVHECGDYTRVYCGGDYFGTLFYCDADGNLVGRSEFSDTPEYCDGQAGELKVGTVPIECTGEG